MLETGAAKPPPRRSDRSSCAAVSCTPSVPGPASAAAASSTVIGARQPAPSLRPAPDRRSLDAPRRARSPRLRANAAGHDHQRDERSGGDAERDCRLPARDPQRHRDRKADARSRLHQHEPAEQAEALVSGQPAAREVARRVGERADHEHVVERALAFEHVVHQLVCAAPARRRGRSSAKLAWISIGTRSRVLRAAARAAFGDRAREQLFDRPVDHRDDHEHHRPQNVEPLRRFFAQHVAGDREVRERQQAGRGDPDRQDPRARAVAGETLAGAPRVRPRLARPASLWRGSQSRTSNIVQGNGERTSTTSP